jgi:glycerol transport system ATP-binding protein
MKWVLRSQLKQLHRRFGYTMVYVTHDQTEALTFAEKVVVMYDGEIVQIGTPAELFERPKHTFVGYFIGSPGMNVMPIEIDGTNARLGGQVIALPGVLKAKAGGSTELGIRPEYVRLGSEGMPVSVSKVEDIGRHKVVRASLEGREIAAILGEDESIPADPKIVFDPAGINIYADSWRVETGG